MKFYSRNWYYIGGILFVIMSFVMGFFGDGVSQIEKILIFSFMSLLVHQFEEYGLPGGFPAFFNVIMNGEKEAPDRYPQNSQLAMVVNVVLAYPFYMAAIIAMIAAAVIIVALPIKLFQADRQSIHSRKKRWNDLACQKKQSGLASL